MESDRQLTRAFVEEAYALISPHIVKTPLISNERLSRIASTVLGSETTAPKLNLFFKCENLQRGGAFKLRGATHATLRLPADKAKNGVITHSSGNHAAALAIAAGSIGIPCTVIMPANSMPNKIENTTSNGAKVVFSGPASEARESKVDEVLEEMRKEGKPLPTLIPPYDHKDIILGQGTAGLEMSQQFETGDVVGVPLGPPEKLEIEGRKETLKRRLNIVVAPCGGGGLLSGTATTFAESGTLVFGAEPNFEGANDAEKGLADGRRIEVVHTNTIADGLKTPLGVVTWTVISDKNKVRGVYSVNEAEIKRAMKLVLENVKVVVEPSGAVALAVVLFNENFRKLITQLQEDEGTGRVWNVGIIFSGGNVSVERIADLFEA